MKQLEEGTTSRIVFGSQSVDTEEYKRNGWEISSALDFLSEKYFKEDDEENSLN